MEDSGIESGDKMSVNNFENNSNLINNDNISESDDSSNNNIEVIFKGISNSSNQSNSLVDSTDTNQAKNFNTINKKNPSNHFSCKTLQRKLELKVERAKRNYNQYHENTNKTAKPSLIPINRLQIPGFQENVPLVEYKSENSDDDELSYYQVNKSQKSSMKQDLSDTFSLQEMTIMGGTEDDSDDSESQNLEFLSPSSARSTVLDKFTNWFCCSAILTNNSNSPSSS